MNNTTSIIIDNYKEEMISRIQALVRIPSVEGEPSPGAPFGKGPAAALGYVLNAGRELGFHVQNFDNYAGHVEYGSGGKTVAVLAHVDTVPVGQGWTVDPYGAITSDGKIYGRGSYDDKGACIAALYALKALKDAGFEPQGKIRLIYGANEETGMKDIPYYLTKEKEPDMAFSPDAPFPVIHAEKGILNIRFEKKCEDTGPLKSLTGGTSPKFVPDQCQAELMLKGEEMKAAIEALDKIRGRYGYNYGCEGDNLLTVTICGKSASGTRPCEGVNAISGMMKYLSHIDSIGGDMRQLINLYNSKIGEETDGRSAGCAFTDDISTPLTLNVGVVNMTEGNVAFDIHIRYPVKASYTAIFGSLARSLSCGSGVVEIREHSPAHYVPSDSPLVMTLMDIYCQVTGDHEAVPGSMEGGTYARTLKNAVAFGPLFPGEKQTAHGPDEYVNINSIVKAAKIYAQALMELSISP